MHYIVMKTQTEKDMQEEKRQITYQDIKHSPEVRAYIKQADISLAALGYTEHSFAHVTKCAEVAGKLLEDLGYESRMVELAKIGAFMHDIGNVVNRIDHAQSGAMMAFWILDKMGMPYEETALIINAIGNHDEGTSFPVNALSAAVIIADKSDVRRSRVRNKETISSDIHDRVNYAVEKSELVLNKDKKEIELYLTIDSEISSVMDYFEIFLQRMLLCRKAADFFGLSFKLNINGTELG